MTDRRHADERLASRLDQAVPPGEARTPRDTSDPLVNTALLLARMRVPPLSAEADARIEARVLAAMRTRQRPARRVVPLVRWLVAACLAVAFVSAGIVPLAAQSLPGDPLYGVKRGLEQVELLVARTPVSQALVNLTQAERRLEEGLRLAEQGRYEPSLEQAALSSLNASASALDGVNDEAVARAVEQRSAIVTLRFSALTEESSVHPPLLPTPPVNVPVAEGAADDGPDADETEAVSPPDTASDMLVMPTRRPTALPLPPGLSTRLAPAADMIATRVAEPTATPPAWGVNGNPPGNNSGGDNPNAGPGNNSGIGNGNGNSNGNANGNSNGSGGDNPNAGPGNNSGNGNTDPGGGNANPNSGPDNNSAGGNANGNATGNANGNANGNADSDN